MGKIIGLLILALLGFYVAWPGYSAYRIKTALDTDDAALLAAKVDFESVRGSLRPAVMTEVEKAMTAAVQQGGAENRPLLEQIKAQVMPKVVEAALNTVVTPESILRIHREGGDYKATIARIVAEKIGAGGLGVLAGAASGGGGGGLGGLIGSIAKGKGVDPGKVLGGLFGKKDGDPVPAPEPEGDKPDGGKISAGTRFTLANVKRFSITGPLAFSVGVAKDPASADPDVTADLAFTGGDWKLVGLRPRA